MTVKDLIKTLEGMLNEIGIPLSHFKTDMEAPPLAVFSESEERYSFGDDSIRHTVLLFELRYLTQTDIDDNKEFIKSMLCKVNAAFSYKTFYNYEKNIIVHIFDCEVCL